MSASDTAAPSKPTGARRWLRFVPLGIIALGIVAAFASGATRYLSLDALQAQSHTLVAFARAHPVQCAAAYMLLYAAVVAFSLPGALIMTLSGGFLFGPLWGSAAAVVGASNGAVIMFLVARTALGDALRRRAERSGGMLQKLEAGIRENAFTALLTMRLIPALPFWLVNIAAGVVKMPLSTYAAATVLGIIPSTFIYAGIGAGLSRVFASGGKPNLHMIFEPQVLLPLIGLAGLSFVPLLWRLWRKRRGTAGDAA